MTQNKELIQFQNIFAKVADIVAGARSEVCRQVNEILVRRIVHSMSTLIQELNTDNFPNTVWKIFLPVPFCPMLLCTATSETKVK